MKALKFVPLIEHLRNIFYRTNRNCSGIDDHYYRISLELEPRNKK
jgi:hypothetical protein